MTRGILIIGLESSLLTALAAEAGKRVERFAVALMPNRLAEAERVEARLGGTSRIALNWNPGSPISARTLVLSAQNRLGHIDEAILICTPPAVRSEVEELAPVFVETAVNDHIKSWFFLTKELCSAFKARGSGTLALVVSGLGSGTPRDDTADLVGPSVSASFRALSEGLLSASPGKPYQTMGFAAEAGDDSAFAAHVFKIMEEEGKRNTGKWHKFSKHGLFSR
jgi:hypothetical protein